MESDYCDDCGGKCDTVHSTEITDFDITKRIVQEMITIRTLDQNLFLNNFNQPAEFVERKYRNYVHVGTNGIQKIEALVSQIKDDSMKLFSQEYLFHEKINYSVRATAMRILVWVAPLQPHLQVGFLIFLALLVLEILF